jgi:DNA-binding Lrp family transcriptional regulator
MTKEVREARLAGRLPEINITEFAVLFVMAETCRGDSRVASISMSELGKLTGLCRTSMHEAVKKLAALGYVRKRGGGNQYQALSYDVLPSDCSVSRTNTDEVIVQSDEVIVQPGERDCSASRTHPSSDVNPEGRASATPAPDPIPEEEPDRYCPKHMPFGTPGKCRACGTARVTHDAWTQAVEVRRSEARQARRAAIDNCPHCDDNGMRETLAGLKRCQCNQGAA